MIIIENRTEMDWKVETKKETETRLVLMMMILLDGNGTDIGPEGNRRIAKP